MTIVKIQDLSGVALNWAVAKVERVRVVVPNCWKNCDPLVLAKISAAKVFPYGPPAWEPSTKWAQGGPIIDREKLSIEPLLVNGDWYGEWRAVCYNWKDRQFTDVTGPELLVAAMRCYVGAVVGSTINIPKAFV